MTDALVVPGQDTTTAVSGTGVVESVHDLAQALQGGSWLEVGLAGVGAALDVAATVVDPLGSLIAAGLGWLMDHLEPLKGWLDDLTGDAGAVAGFAGTWDHVAAAMGTAGEDLSHMARADLEAMQGAAVVAYARYADDLAAKMRASSASSSAVASALRTCATVVQVVHDLVRDTIAQLVGSIISWAAEAVFTLGLATPWIVGQVSTRVSSLATRVGRSVVDVVTSAKSLKNLVEAMREALARLAASVRRSADAPHARPDGPVVHTGGEHGPRPRQDWRAEEWSERVYDSLRADPDLAADMARHNPEFSQADVDRAMDHVLRDEHLLGTDYDDPYTGRFDASPDMAEAFERLRSGTATELDRMLLRHEIAEARYMDAHPGASYAQAHRAATEVSDWRSALDASRRG